MMKQRFLALILIVLVITIAMAGCRREEEPTPAATADTAGGEPTIDPATEQPEADKPTSEPPTKESTEEQPPVDLDYDWPPQVVYSSPARGEELMLDGAITIRFDQPMDQASVEESLVVSPAGKTTSVDGHTEWPRPDTLIFAPEGQLARQQLYDVEVKDSARGLNGKPLREPVKLQVETVGFLEVSQVLPTDGTTEVQTDGLITVMFNRPVVPLVSSGQQADLPQPLVFDPPVSGEGQWVSTSVYRFVPDQPLQGATNYQISIPAGLEDVTGGVLDETFSWRFSTLSPSVVTIVPEHRVMNVSLTRPMTVTFNMPMEQGVTGAAVSLSPPAPYSLVWSEDSRQVSLVPDGMLDLATDYRLEVAESARSAGGQAALDRTTGSSFSTVLEPAVLDTEPGSGQTADHFQRGVRIAFASPMDLATLEDRVRIEPAPDRTTYFFNDWDFSLFIDFEMSRNTEYEVTVPGTASDPYGNTIGEDYTWRFTTPGHAPMVTLNLPAAVSQLSTNRPTNVNVIHRNISRIDAELYDVGAPVARLVSERVQGSAQLGPLVRNWSLPVASPPETADVYELQLADGDVLPTGVYYLRVSAPESDEEHTYWQNQESLLVVADTNLVVKENFESVHVWATDMATGQPAAGRNITVYNQYGAEIGRAVTDADGLARVANLLTEGYLAGVLAVSNGPGEAGFGVASSNWYRGVTPWSFGVDVGWNAEMPLYAYIHTDRPIYRPGDTVHFHGIVRDTNYGRYPFPTAESVTLNMDYLARYEPTEFTFTAELDENGEFSGEYLIPDDAGLGNYRLYFQDRDIEGDRIFTVAEYRAPEFQVTATPDQDEALRGDAVVVLVEASYFSGGPAADLAIDWTASASDYRLPWEGPYYSFGDNANVFSQSQGNPFVADSGPPGQAVASGQGLTDTDGRFLITLPADLLDEVDPGSREVTVTANVLDISNFPVFTTAEVVFHDGEIYPGVVPSRYFGQAGQTSSVEVITVNWDGQPAPDRQIELTLYERLWTPVRDETFGQYFTRWQAEDTEVDRKTVTTDGLGKATADFVPPRGGSYVVVATVADDAGRQQSSSTFMWVADVDAIGWPTDPREKRMDLAADQDEYRPGDTARILVQSPFAGPANAWVTIERGDVIDQRLVTLQSDSEILEIPISSSYAPNVFVTVHVVKGVDESNPVADVRIGLTELIVSAEQLALNMTLTPKSDLLSPGDTAEYDLLVTDHLGNPVQANFSLALVDLAVLSLKADNAPHIIEAFYRRQPLRSQTGAGLIVSGEGLEVEIPSEILGRGGGGGGGADEAVAAAVALQGDEDEQGQDVRADFQDTAFWEAQVSTDPSGRATVSIPLPDNVTTWRLSSKGVSDYAARNDTLVGQTEADIVSTLPLLIRPITPRFFTVGDDLLLGAVIHNNTVEQLEVTVALEAAGLILAGPAEQEVTIPPGQRQVVRWPVTVNDVPFADLTFRAEGGQYRDATKPTFGSPPDQLIPVVRYAGEDVVGTSGILDETERRVEAILLPEQIDTRQGAVEVELSPSLAAALTTSLRVVNYLEEDRPACAHATADQLLPNVATMRAYQELPLPGFDQAGELERLIIDGIADLERLQKSNGGWGWCYSTQSDPFLSGHVLFALAMARDAGFEIDRDVLDGGVRYVQDLIVDAADLAFASEVNRQAFFLYVLAELGQADAADMDALFDEHRALLDPYAKALLAMAFDLTGQSAEAQSLLGDLNDSAILSAAGAYWQDAEPDWNNLNSDIRGTAMVLEALSRLDSSGLLAPNAARWLMVARRAGHWPTGHDTAWSIMALSDWMAVSGELEADYDYQVDVNTERLAAGRFESNNVTANEELSVPLTQLLPAEVNYLTFQRDEGPGRLYYTAYLDSFISAENLEPLERGFTVERAYFDAACDPNEEECQPIDEIEAGQDVRVELTIVVHNDGVYVVVADPIPAGTEAVDPGLAISDPGQGGRIQRADESYHHGYWGWWHFNNIEYRDDSVVFTSEFLPAGTYQYSYMLQTTIPGTYQVIPATARQEFFPDVFGRSNGSLFEITE